MTGQETPGERIMKRIGLCGIFLLLLVGVVQPAGRAFIGFNEAGLVPGFGPNPYFPDGPKGTAITNQFQSLGVLFSISNGEASVSNDSILRIAGSVSTTNQNYLVVNTVPPNVTRPWATLSARFVDPLTGLQATASGFSVTVSDGNAMPNPRITVQAFGVNGALLESYNLTSLASALAFTSSNIGRIDFVDSGGDGHIIDNFAFTLNPPPPPSQIPEPATLSLLGAGFFVAAFVIRRRRS
jgi:hypothetical protein